MKIKIRWWTLITASILWMGLMLSALSAFDLHKQSKVESGEAVASPSMYTEAVYNLHLEKRKYTAALEEVFR